MALSMLNAYYSKGCDRTNKEYFNSLEDYRGKVLLLGTSYDKNSLKHNFLVEVVEI